MRHFIISALALSFLCSCSSETYVLDIGTYGDHWYKVCFRGGSFSAPIGNDAKNPSYLLSCPGNRVYAVSENGPESAVCSFVGGIMSSYSSETGDDPCHLTKIGKKILTADYSGGSLSVFPLNSGGIIEGRSQVLRFEGSGPVSSRQEHSHIHQVREIPSEMGEGILASDLGSDRIYILKDVNDSLCLSGEIPCPAGSGPRHMEFNPGKGMLYCICELSGHVLVWKAENGEFRPVQDIVADEYDAEGSADIHISADGRYLYTSHRLRKDGICTFRILEDGLLEKLGRTACGKHPRNFWLSPDGRHMLVACTDDRQIQVMRIGRNGIPHKTCHRLRLGDDRPTCVVRN